MEHYFFVCLQEWEYITNAKDFAYGLLNLFLFFCDKTLKVLLIQFFFFYMMPLHAFETFY